MSGTSSSAHTAYRWTSIAASCGCRRQEIRSPVADSDLGLVLVKAKRWQDSASETVQVVLPNDSNPLGFILGGTVMHLIDITGAIACHRHTNTLALTAGVDSLDFIHPIKVGDLIILKSRVTCVFNTSLEVEVEVFSEEIQSGEKKLTSKAYLTFVSLDKDGKPAKVPPLVVDTPEDQQRCRDAQARRAERLKRKTGA